MPIRRPCLDCRELTTNTRRCDTCSARRERLRPNRTKYDGDYPTRSRLVRENARYCWICLEGPRDWDPWQADHLYPDDPNSPLLPAHRSCNIARSRRHRPDDPATA